jgi:hypothetical protein
MAVLNDTTRLRIQGYLEAFITNVVDEVKQQLLPSSMSARQYLRQQSFEGRLKPFHQAIMPTELMRLSAFERSFSTRLGSTFEECARLIALQFHKDARRGHRVSGKVSQSSLRKIEQQVSLFEHASSGRPEMGDMVDAVLASQRQDDLIPLRVVADLWVQQHKGVYEELLEIYQQVGEARANYILDSLAFGF